MKKALESGDSEAPEISWLDELQIMWKGWSQRDRMRALHCFLNSSSNRAELREYHLLASERYNDINKKMHFEQGACYTNPRDEGWKLSEYQGRLIKYHRVKVDERRWKMVTHHIRTPKEHRRVQEAAAAGQWITASQLRAEKRV